jgi:hypothetical protein
MNAEQFYQERLSRHVAAMRNERPDCVPIRPFVAEFTAEYAGYAGQEPVHDFEKAFLAARKCAAGFDWDAIVPDMEFPDWPDDLSSTSGVAAAATFRAACGKPSAKG